MTPVSDDPKLVLARMGKFRVTEWSAGLQPAWERRTRQSRLDTNCKETDAITDAVLVWACISLTHDSAYLSQAMRKVCAKLDKMARS